MDQHLSNRVDYHWLERVKERLHYCRGGLPVSAPWTDFWEHAADDIEVFLELFKDFATWEKAFDEALEHAEFCEFERRDAEMERDELQYQLRSAHQNEAKLEQRVEDLESGRSITKLRAMAQNANERANRLSRELDLAMAKKRVLEARLAALPPSWQERVAKVEGTF